MSEHPEKIKPVSHPEVQKDQGSNVEEEQVISVTVGQVLDQPPEERDPNLTEPPPVEQDPINVDIETLIPLHKSYAGTSLHCSEHSEEVPYDENAQGDDDFERVVFEQIHFRANTADEDDESEEEAISEDEDSAQLNHDHPNAHPNDHPNAHP